MPRIEQRLRPDLGRPVRGKRLGCALHYDASLTDKGALAWLVSPKCKLGYNFLVWDDGRIFEIIPRSHRAPHAGITKSSDPARLPYADNDANSAFYGIAIAAGGKKGDKVTDAQFASVVWLVQALFREHGWDLHDTWRIVSHRSEAWPRGRKSDCEGPDLVHPVLSTSDVRLAVAGRAAA